MASLLRLAVGLSGQGQHVWDPPVKQCHSIGDYLLESVRDHSFALPSLRTMSRMDASNT
jgi:hypothetical protein